jgi:hypothetical protein
MVNYKSAKWCLGVALSLSLSACNMMGMENSQPMTTHHESVAAQPKAVVVSKPKAVQKTYATKDPSQKATPGPMRKAAPQLPVIQ